MRSKDARPVREPASGSYPPSQWGVTRQLSSHDISLWSGAPG